MAYSPDVPEPPADASDRPLPVLAGAASGIGSLPGTQARETAALPLTVLPGLPYLPELPARGPGADMIGRAFGILVELYASLQPSGWRFAEHAGRDTGRARSYLGEDWDAVEEYGQGYVGPYKVQVAGPWTLAATVELRYGDKALADAGACRDLADSLGEGLREHIAEARRRLPGLTDLVVQLDEPALPSVLRGTVATSSGFGQLAAVEAPVVESVLARVLAAIVAEGATPIVHCCADDPPVSLMRSAGAAGLALDLTQLGQSHDEDLGAFVEAGGLLLAGVLASSGRGRAAAGANGLGRPPTAAVLGPVRHLGRRLGLPAAWLAQVIPTPTCGLAAASPAYAREVTERCAELGAILAEEAEQ